MSGPPDVVCVIPARAGSKRIPDKNLQEVGGQSLLQRAIATARAACGAVFVSTDSERYADHARAAGATVPSLRPPLLAADDSTTDEVVRHALCEWCDPGVEIVVVLQPTTPFTIPNDVVRAVDALRSSRSAGTALTAVRLPSSVAYALASTGDGLASFVAPQLRATRTQELPRLHAPTGGVYAAPAQRLRDGGPLIQEPIAIVEVPPARALDVDEPDDLRAAREAAR